MNHKGGLPFIKSSTDQEVMTSKYGGLKQALTLCPGNSFENQSSTCRVANKNLFLFEDVDAIFHEDRGLVTTIMQLAETSKRPIILTTNSELICQHKLFQLFNTHLQSFNNGICQSSLRTLYLILLINC